jgi:hypothetical protein
VLSSVWMRFNQLPHLLQNAPDHQVRAAPCGNGSLSVDQIAYLSGNLTSSSVPKTRPDLGFTKWALRQTVHLIGNYRQSERSSSSSLHACTWKPVVGQR